MKCSTRRTYGRKSTERRHPLMVAVFAAGLVATVGCAADPSPPAPTVPVNVERDVVATQDLVSTAAEAAPAGDAAKVADYLDEMARLGENYSTADLAVTTAEPNAGDVTIVAPEGYAPVAVETAQVEVDGGVNSGLGVAMAETGEIAQPTSGSGFGFSGGVSARGMSRLGGTCATQYFDPAYPSKGNEDHRLTTCWEKWKSNSSSNYVYNRWAYFTKAPSAIGSSKTRDFTIRSRPWKGTESRVTSMTGHTPAPSGSCGSSANFSLSAGPASISIPIHKCASLKTLEDANRKSGGIDWNGETSSQLFLDFAMGLTATSTPTYADYSWMEVQYCEGSPCWAPSKYLKKADSGF